MDPQKLKECFGGEPEQVQCVSQANDSQIEQEQDVDQVNFNEQEGCNVAVACGGTAVAVQYVEQANYNAQIASACQTNQNAQVNEGLAYFGDSCANPDISKSYETNFNAKMDKNDDLTVNGKKIKSKDMGEGLKMFVLDQVSKSKNIAKEIKD